MEERRKKADWPIIAGAILCLTLAALGAYTTAYYALSKTVLASGKSVIRSYDTKWQAALFAPAAKVESMLRRQQIVLVSEDMWDAMDSSVPGAQ